MKKGLLLVLSLFLIIGMYTFAGGSKESMPTATEPEKETKDEVVELTLMSWHMLPDWFEAEMVEFNKLYPKIKINYEFLQYADYINKLKIDFASGKGPDLAGFQPGGMIKSYVNFLEPLAPLCKRDMGENWKNDFLNIALRQAELSGTELYGMPLSVSIAGTMWVNSNKLSIYGLSIPKNISEMKKATDILRENDEIPMYMGAADAWICLDVFMAIANDFSPAKLYGAINGTNRWDEKELIKAFEVWKSLFTEGILQDGALGVNHYTAVVDSFTNNNIGAFQPNGSWHVERFMDPNQAPHVEEIGMMPAPLPDFNGDGKTAPVTAGVGTLVGMNKDLSEEKKNAAWTYIQWEVTRGLEEIIKRQYAIPAYKPLEPVVEVGPAGEKAISIYSELAAESVAGDREIPYPEIVKALGDALQEIAIGEDIVKAVGKLQEVSDSTER
jgi:raffinose/stachyose/melibiose transport system substrate-binding protein